MIGTSLKVHPVAKIPSMVGFDVPRILINREPLPHVGTDMELLGSGDTITRELASRLGWSLDGEAAVGRMPDLPFTEPPPRPGRSAAGDAAVVEPSAAAAAADAGQAADAGGAVRLYGRTCAFDYYPPARFAFDGAHLAPLRVGYSSDSSSDEDEGEDGEDGEDGDGDESSSDGEGKTAGLRGDGNAHNGGPVDMVPSPSSDEEDEAD